MLTQKTAKAYAVLAILTDLNTSENEFSVEFYQNGREQGFAIRSHDFLRKAAFSENRNSDDIVVYTGNINEFSMQGNTPSHETNAKYFRYNQYYEAAKYVGVYLGIVDSGV